jgi:hypothetical protein
MNVLKYLSLDLTVIHEDIVNGKEFDEEHLRTLGEAIELLETLSENLPNLPRISEALEDSPLHQPALTFPEDSKNEDN